MSQEDRDLLFWVFGHPSEHLVTGLSLARPVLNGAAVVNCATRPIFRVTVPSLNLKKAFKFRQHRFFVQDVGRPHAISVKREPILSDAVNWQLDD